MYSPTSTLKVVINNIIAFLPGHRWTKIKRHTATNEYVMEKFKEEIAKTDYLNPLLDMCYELGYDIWDIMLKSVVTTNKTKEFWHYLFWKGSKIYYSPWDHLALKWRIKKVISYYDDIVNYLFITWQLEWYLETYKDEIEPAILGILRRPSPLKMKPTQPHDSLQSSECDETDYTKSQTSESNKNHSMQSDVITEKHIESKSNISRTKKSTKKSYTKKQSKA